MTLLDRAMSTDLDWSLCLIGVAKPEKIGELIMDLRGYTAPQEDGKRITSGFAYWGVAPTIAWCDACNDDYYPVMNGSIRSFPTRWGRVSSKLPDSPFHYISLGPGTGDKDKTILDQLAPASPTLCYIPVDMSSEMLRVAVQLVTRETPLSIGRDIIPVQLDFSDPDSVSELRVWLDAVFRDEPLLFSLLGNTLANFDNDAELLASITEKLLGPHDRLLLEVATTSQLSQDLADLAATEYRSSQTFYRWVVSALQQYTDVTIDRDSVKFNGTVEGNHALRVTIMYTNSSGKDLRVLLPDLATMPFPPEDTIRVDLTRKYARNELGSMFSTAKLTELDRDHHQLGRTRAPRGPQTAQFGIDLVLLERRDDGVTVVQPGPASEESLSPNLRIKLP